MMSVQSGSSRVESVMQNCLVLATRRLRQRLLLARCPSSMMDMTALMVSDHRVHSGIGRVSKQMIIYPRSTFTHDFPYFR